MIKLTEEQVKLLRKGLLNVLSDELSETRTVREHIADMCIINFREKIWRHEIGSEEFLTGSSDYTHLLFEYHKIDHRLFIHLTNGILKCFRAFCEHENLI